MSDFQVYFTDSGSPKTGLTPTFDSLNEADGGGAVATGGVTITEIGGGWYNFADLAISEKFVGSIDGGAAIVIDAERFVPISLSPEDFPKKAFASAVFDETADVIKFAAFMENNAGVITTGITKCEIKVFDDVHTLLFTISTVSSTNGVFIITKSSPGFTKNKIFYATVEMTDGDGTITTIDIFIAIE